MSTQPFKKVQLHADEQDGCWLTTTLNDGRQLAPQQVSPVTGWRFAKGYHHPDNMYVGRRLRRLVLERFYGERLVLGWTGKDWLIEYP